MWTTVSSAWERIRGSLWFIPSVMALTAAALAFISLWVDQHLMPATGEDSLAWIYGGGADGARDVLSTVASSMITVAGVMFSITVVALTLASQQFGPRLLRNFMHDLGNQIVLGSFISIHLYCLVVLKAVRTEKTGGFVPHLSVSMTLLFALAGAGVLIYFFHHVTSSIRASSVISAVAADLEAVIDRLFPEQVAEPGPPPDAEAVRHIVLPDFDRAARPIPSSSNGYVQVIDMDCLMTLATAEALIIRLACRPGDFVTRGTTIAAVYPHDRTTDDVTATVNEAYVLGDERTVVQDLLFPAEQLAEMAVRALSPGTNDPSTALACIDRLGSAFILMASRHLPSPYRYDDSGRFRLVAYPVPLSEMIDATFGPIRQYGRSSSAVTLRLLDTIIRVAPFVTSADARTALSRQAAMIQRGSAVGLAEDWDRKTVQARFHAAIEALQEKAA